MKRVILAALAVAVIILLRVGREPPSGPGPGPESDVADRPHRHVPRVVVLDTRDRPLPGVAVSVHPRRGLLRDHDVEPTGEPIGVLQSGSAGGVNLRALADGHWWLHAEHAGRSGCVVVRVGAPDVRDPAVGPVGAGRRVALVLRETRRATIRVVAAGGRPVPDAIVAVYDPDRARRPSSWRERLGVPPWAHAVTGSEGTATFAFHPGRGLHDARRLRVVVPRFGGRPAERELKWAGRTATCVVRVPALQRVRLRVLDRRGRPVDDMWPVSWCTGTEDPRHPMIEWVDRKGSRWIDDALATVHLWIPSGGVALAAFAPGGTVTFSLRTPTRGTTVALPESPRHDIALVLPPRPPRLRVRLVDAAGRELDRSHYRLTLEHREGSDSVPAHGHVGGSWVHRVEPARPGTLLVRERGASWRGPLAATHVPTLVNDEEHDVGELVVEPLPHLVSGRVVDTAGRPLGGETVRADEMRDHVRCFAQRNAVTGPQGRFEIRGTPRPGCSYSLVMGSPARATRLRFEPGAKDVVLVATRP